MGRYHRARLGAMIRGVRLPALGFRTLDVGPQTSDLRPQTNAQELLGEIGASEWKYGLTARDGGKLRSEVRGPTLLLRREISLARPHLQILLQRGNFN
jgi:hypothetical protein